jgi:hypothetical protein
MNILVNEINRACKEKKITLEVLSHIEEEKIWGKLQQKFNLQMDGQLWCQIKFPHNSYDTEGWKRVPEVFEDWPVLMFFDPYKKAPIYKFSSKVDVVKLLEETFHFVFYLASLDLSKIAVYDDHECIRVISDV